VEGPWRADEALDVGGYGLVAPTFQAFQVIGKKCPVRSGSYALVEVGQTFADGGETLFDDLGLPEKASTKILASRGGIRFSARTL